MEYHVGQRLSLKSQLCTVRYVGQVAQKPGEWLGVEWDDPNRGKHNGSHDGVVYFQCRSSSPTAASFLRPNQTWDATKTFLEALREKYMPKDTGTQAAAVYFSSKQAEEIGFEKFARRQAQLQGIHVLVLDRMCINAKQIEHDGDSIAEICAHITELDLSGNLFENLDEIIRLCTLLPKLRRLVLDGNRFHLIDQSLHSSSQTLMGVQTLDLSNTLFAWSELCSIASIFPNVTTLIAANNGIDSITTESFGVRLKLLDLSGNRVSAFSDLQGLSCSPTLTNLSLKHNIIHQISQNHTSNAETLCLGSKIQDLDLAHNKISSWSILNAIPPLFPDAKHVRVTGNPLYNELRSAEGKLLASEDGHMLTIARLPQLESLNYSKITEKERLNAEVYYLGQIAVELSLAIPGKADEILSQHPRWKDLCEEYGEPNVAKRPAQDELDPNSLAAKLVTITFALSPGLVPGFTPRQWIEEVPKSVNIYALQGMVGKQLGVMPHRLRLMWETGERDPIGLDRGYAGPDWWDSSDDESNEKPDESMLVLREVELVPGTRATGTYIEGREARVRVEARDG